MRTIDRDYRYLLQNIIPHSRLPQELRKSIEGALKVGDNAELRRQSILALERLHRDSYFSKPDTVFQNGYVIVTYIKNDGVYQVRLYVPRDEWETIITDESGRERPEEIPASVTDAPPPSAAVETTIEILPEVIRSLSISDRSDSMMDRLNALMGMLPEWLQVLQAEMLLFQETPERYTVTGEYIRGISEQEVRQTPIYEQVKTSGHFKLLEVGEARREGLELNSEKARCVAVIPVHSGEEFKGFMQILIEQPPQDESVGGRIEVARRIVEEVITINERIEDITSIDVLTGIYNRHFYETQLPIEIERATRTGGKLSMLLIDIDDFKVINDTYGHKKGDEALSAISGLIKKNLRKIDLPFRYGGEEFVILLPGTAEIEAVHTAERLRSVIQSFEGFTDDRGKTRPITVSIGVAVFPDNARTEDELFIKADAAMFRAKHFGKNRVEQYRD